MSDRWGFTTKAIHGGRIDDANKSVAPPIYQTATFYYDTAEEGIRIGQEISPGYIYTRWANPTTRLLEERVALREGAEDALALSSGMAAVTAAVMTVLKPGDHAVAPRAIYQASYQLFADVLPKYGIETTLLTGTDLELYEQALRPNTRLLFIETPNNPVMDITDISGVIALARGRDAMTIADNTFATPYNQNPIALGVDVVVHSATKYLGGHHDVAAGVVVGSGMFIHSSKRHARIFGTTIDPFAAWLVVRGLATLGLRVERQNRSTLALAEFLAGHPRVERVHYPGLSGHRGHDAAKRQMRGFGGMLSFEVAGGLTAGVRVLESLRVCKRATSLGGITTLVSHPAGLSNVHMPKEVREAAGITDGLIRVSVGVEDEADLLADFDQALATV